MGPSLPTDPPVPIEMADAKDFIKEASEGYYLVNGGKVADDKTDLLDGTLDNPIRRSQNNLNVNNYAYTGTYANGVGYPANNCINWTYTGSSYYGAYGRSNYQNTYWTLTGWTYCHYTNFKLYCFEND